MFLEHEEVPSKGFYVSNGKLYFNGERVPYSINCAQRANPCEPGEFSVSPSQSNPCGEVDILSMGDIVDINDSNTENIDGTKLFDCIDDAIVPTNKERIWTGGIVWDAASTWDNSYVYHTVPYHTAYIDDKYIEQIVKKVTDYQQVEINLLQAQVDSLQSQINIISSVNIEESFEDEKFDSFKNRAKDALGDACALIEDIEGLNKLHQIKCIKEEILTENKKQLIITQQDVKKRLERLYSTKRPHKNTQVLRKLSYIVIFAIITTILVFTL